jgi:drug/metabolite transporter (DMT)-like permease
LRRSRCSGESRYLFIKVAVDGGVPPLLLAWGRIALAAAVLLPIAWRSGALAPLRGRGRWLLAYAVAELAIRSRC